MAVGDTDRRCEKIHHVVSPDESTVDATGVRSAYVAAIVACCGSLIIRTYGTILDCENECEQNTVILEECAPMLR